MLWRCSFTSSRPLLVCRKRTAGSIFVLNLLLGWTLIGWAIALKWALTREEQKPEATPDFDQDRRLDPDDASAYFGRGNAYADTRHRDPDQSQSESMDTSRDTYTTMVSDADVERIVDFVMA